MIDELQEVISKTCRELFGAYVKADVVRADEQFGDYASNVALQLAGKTGKNPREIAEQLVAEIQKNDLVAKTDVAGPGFINLTLKDEILWRLAQASPPRPLEGQEILVEFGDPNPFKEMHIGHLYTALVGDAIAGLLENQGATVRRLSYHGDVGLHVAKSIWAIQKALDETAGLTLADVFESVTIMGHYYAVGHRAYGEDETAANEIKKINELIYTREDPRVNEIYDTGRTLSLELFDEIYSDVLHIGYSKHYYESDSTKAGLSYVKDNTGKVFKESQGAIIYEGEKKGLHTRVFITSQGLPTYEAKDLGLAELKDHDYPDASRSIIITASEQSEYFKVMLAALAEINSTLAAKTTHLSHGFLNLSTGKMSSRTGNVLSAVNLMDTVKATVNEKYPNSLESVYLAAIKYGFLKHRLGSDITYDVEESVSIEGNSGPYLQYAHARAKSILAKNNLQYMVAMKTPVHKAALEQVERSLLRKISEYPEIINNAANELMPHHVANYLYELAQEFNRFYEKSKVIGDPREELRVRLVELYAQTLKRGLNLLGIEAPEKM